MPRAEVRESTPHNRHLDRLLLQETYPHRLNGLLNRHAGMPVDAPEWLQVSFYSRDGAEELPRI
jgi:hypothetical protein